MKTNKKVTEVEVGNDRCVEVLRGILEERLASVPPGVHPAGREAAQKDRAVARALEGARRPTSPVSPLAELRLLAGV